MLKMFNPDLFTISALSRIALSCDDRRAKAVSGIVSRYRKILISNLGKRKGQIVDAAFKLRVETMTHEELREYVEDEMGRRELYVLSLIIGEKGGQNDKKRY